VSVPATYATLQAKVVDLLHRTGDTAVTALAPDWIGYAESEMQTRIKLMEFETSATVTITAGSGTLPTGYVGMRSVYWVGSPNRPITYIPPEQYDAYRANDSGDGYYYTITGSTIRTTPMGDGSIVCTYLARFTPLSDSNTSNALLTNFPDLYVYGAMKHANVWTQDDAAVQKFGLMFNAVCDRVNDNNEQRKYGQALAVRAR
jgi:hypothetical protein